MKKFLFLTTLSTLLLSSQTKAQDLDLSSRIESAITLSNDTSAMPETGTVLTKSYTVPFGYVLKITSGKLTSLSSTFKTNPGKSQVYVTKLMVNDNTIIGQGPTTTTSPVKHDWVYEVSALSIDAKNPIWVSQGQTVILTTVILGTTDEPSFVSGSWINGLVCKINYR